MVGTKKKKLNSRHENSVRGRGKAEEGVVVDENLVFFYFLFISRNFYLFIFILFIQSIQMEYNEHRADGIFGITSIRLINTVN